MQTLTDRIGFCKRRPDIHLLPDVYVLITTSIKGSKNGKIKTLSYQPKNAYRHSMSTCKRLRLHLRHSFDGFVQAGTGSTPTWVCQTTPSWYSVTSPALARRVSTRIHTPAKCPGYRGGRRRNKPTGSPHCAEASRWAEQVYDTIKTCLFCVPFHFCLKQFTAFASIINAIKFTKL